MYEASSDTSENYNTMTEIINEYGFDGEKVLDLLLDWHGLQLLSEDFMENLIACEL